MQPALSRNVTTSCNAVGSAVTEKTEIIKNRHGASSRHAFREMCVRALITAKGSLSIILSCKQLASSFDCTIWVGLKSFEVLSELLWTQNELKPRERQVLGASYLELELLHSHRYQASQHISFELFNFTFNMWG